MLFYFIRHGDPVYDPDSLTPLGQRQAEAVGRRLAVYGLDRIYASSSERAKLTAKPTCELLHKSLEILDWCNESHAWRELTYPLENGSRTWLFAAPAVKKLFCTEEMARLRFKWYEHPMLQIAGHDYKSGIERVEKETYAFFAGLGYVFDEETGCYRCEKPSNERVALFAHQGFGLAFLSCVLHIPYPEFSSRFDMNHSGVTVIDFPERDGCAIPCVLTLSDCGHIYKENLPMRYQNRFPF